MTPLEYDRQNRAFADEMIRKWVHRAFGMLAVNLVLLGVIWWLLVTR